MVPPLVTASRWAPGRPVSVPVDAVPDERGGAARRTRRSGSGRPACRGRPRAPTGAASRTAPRGGPARSRSSTVQSSDRHHRDDLLGEHVERVARVRGAPRSRRRASARPRRPSAPGRRGTSGRSRPRETAPTWWPARPMRCRPLATEGGDSTWMTRSTAPMSMPSSRLEVATTAGSRPALSASSIIGRCSLRHRAVVGPRHDSPGAPRPAARLRHELRQAAAPSARRLAVLAARRPAR